MKKTIRNKTMLLGLMCSMVFVTSCGCSSSNINDPLSGRGKPKYILNETLNQARLSDDLFTYYHVGTTGTGKAKYAVELKESIRTSTADDYLDDYATINVPSQYGENENTVVTGIWRGAFAGCRSTTITLPSTITDIDYEAFLYSEITSITIPYSITNIGEGAFYACPNLTTVTFENDNAGASSAGAVTCACEQTESGNTPVYCTLTTIPSFCFFKCSALTTLTLPASIQEIGYEAFNGCKNLASDIYFQSIRTIRSRAFQSCTSLRKIYISRSLFKKDNEGNTGTIEKHAFNFCDSEHLEIYFCGGTYTEGEAPNQVTKDEIDEWLKNAENKIWGWYTDINDPYDAEGPGGLSAANNLSFVKVSGDVYYTQEWTFTISYNETDEIYDVTITKYNGSRDNIKFLSVPDSMALNVPNRVTRINVDAFDSDTDPQDKIKTNLERLYLSKHLVAIENRMFAGFQELFVVDDTSACADDWNNEKTDPEWNATGRIDLSNLTELKYIGERAFAFMGKNDSVREKVERIHLPANLVAVGAEAFGVSAGSAYPKNFTNHYIFKNVSLFEWDYDEETSRLESVGSSAFFKLGCGSYEGDPFNRIRTNYSYVAHEATRIIFPRTFKGFGMTPNEIADYAADGFTFTTEVDGLIDTKPMYVFGACPLIKEAIFKGSAIDNNGKYALDDTTNLLIPAQTFANCSSLETVIFEERVNKIITFHTQAGEYAMPAIGSNAGRYGNDFRGDPTLQTIVLPNVYTKLRFQDFALQGNARAAVYLSGALDGTLKTIEESEGVQNITDTGTRSIVGENSNKTPYSLADNASTSISNIKQWCTIGDETFYTSSAASSSGYYGYVYNSTASAESNGYVNSFGIDQWMPIYENVHYIEQINTGTEQAPVMKTIVEVGKPYHATNNPNGKELVFDGKYAYVCFMEDSHRVATVSKYRLNTHDTDATRYLAHVPGKVTYGGNDYIVTRIGDSAFSAAYCDLLDGTTSGNVLTTVELPDSIVEIGDYAFLRAYGVSKVSAYPVNAAGASTGVAVDYNMPKDLRLIGKNAFTFCNVIQFLNIPYDCLFYENANDTYDVASVFTNDLSLRKITFRDESDNPVNQIYSAYYWTTVYDEDTGYYISGTFGGVDHKYGTAGVAYDERFNLQLPEVEDATYSHIIKNVYLEEGDSFKIAKANGQGGFAWYGGENNGNDFVTVASTGYYDIKLSAGLDPRITISATAQEDRNIIHGKTTALYSTDGAFNLISSDITANNGSNTSVASGVIYITNDRNNGSITFKELSNDAGYQYYVAPSAGTIAVDANLANITVNGEPISNVSGFYFHIWNESGDNAIPYTECSQDERFLVSEGHGSLTLSISQTYTRAKFIILFNNETTYESETFSINLERDRKYSLQVGSLTVDTGSITSGVSLSVTQQDDATYAPENETAKYYVRIGNSGFIPLVVNQNAVLGNGVAQEYKLAEKVDFKAGDVLRLYKADALQTTPHNENRLLLVLNRDSEDIFMPSLEVTKIYNQSSELIGIEFDGEHQKTNQGTANSFLFGAYKMGYWISYLNLGPSTYIENDPEEGVVTQVLFSAIVDRDEYEGDSSDVHIYLNVPIAQYVNVPKDSYDNAKRDLVSISGDIFNVANYAFSGCERLAQIYFKYKSGGVIPEGVFKGAANAHLIYTTPGSTPGSVINTDVEGILDLSNSGYAKISYQAFYNNTGIREVDVPTGVVAFEIEASAFEGCSNLTTLDLSGVTDSLTIGSRAFYGTSINSLTSPTSPNLSIGSRAFFQQDELTSFDFTHATDSLTIGEFAFYQAGLTGKVTFPAVENLTISANAFKECKSITCLDFSNVTGNLVIDTSAFAGCTSLERIIWPTDPNAHVVIRDSAYSGCSKLAYAGYDDQSDKFVMHNNTTSIGANAFEKCRSIVDLVLPSELGHTTPLDKNVIWGQNSFLDCTSLVTVDVSAENPYLWRMDRYIFKGCTNLSSFAFEKFTFNETMTVDKITRTGFQVYRYAFQNCTSLGSIGDRTLVIPENYCFIGVQAFEKTAYEKIIFEGDGIELRQSAFASCEDLVSVEFVNPDCAWRDTDPTTADNSTKMVFKDCPKLEYLFLPTGFNLGTDDHNEDMVNGDNLVVIYTHSPQGTSTINGGWRYIRTDQGESGSKDIYADVAYKLTALNQTNISEHSCSGADSPIYYWIDYQDYGFIYLGSVVYGTYVANDRVQFDSGYIYLNDGTLITDYPISSINDVLEGDDLKDTTTPYYIIKNGQAILLGPSIAYNKETSPKTVTFASGYVLRGDGYLVTENEIVHIGDALTAGGLTSLTTSYWATINGVPTIIGTSVAYDPKVGVLFADGHLIETNDNWIAPEHVKEITNGISDTLDLEGDDLVDSNVTVYWMDDNGPKLLGYSIIYDSEIGVFFSGDYLMKSNGEVVRAVELTDSSDALEGDDLKDTSVIYWMNTNPKTVLGTSTFYADGVGVFFSNGYLVNGTTPTPNVKLITSYADTLDDGDLVDTNVTSYYYNDGLTLTSLGNARAYDERTGVLFSSGYLLKTNGDLIIPTSIVNSSETLNQDDSLISNTRVYWTYDNTTPIILGTSDYFYDGYGVFFSNGYLLDGTTLVKNKVITAYSEAIVNNHLIDTNETVYFMNINDVLIAIGHSVAYNAKYGVLFDAEYKLLNTNQQLVATVQIMSSATEVVNDSGVVLNGCKNNIYWFNDGGTVFLLGKPIQWKFKGSPGPTENSNRRSGFYITKGVLFDGDMIMYYQDNSPSNRADHVYACTNVATGFDLANFVQDGVIRDDVKSNEYYLVYNNEYYVLGKPVWYQTKRIDGNDSNYYYSSTTEYSINFEYLKLKLELKNNIIRITTGRSPYGGIANDVPVDNRRIIYRIDGTSGYTKD